MISSKQGNCSSLVAGSLVLTIWFNPDLSSEAGFTALSRAASASAGSNTAGWPHHALPVVSE